MHSSRLGWPASWHTADWSTSGIAPRPTDTPEAVVQVYAARAGRWKGIFAVHTWIAVKRARAPRFDRYDVVVSPAAMTRKPGEPFPNAPAALVTERGIAWLQQLRFLKADIIGKVNTCLGEALVGEIKFKIGPV